MPSGIVFDEIWSQFTKASLKVQIYFFIPFLSDTESKFKKYRRK